jgi:predicted nucleic acid-binding protein
MRSYYIDSSAILSVVFGETNAKAMKPFLGSIFYSSQITRVEVIRAVFRIAPEREEVARKLLDAITIVPMRTAIVNQAERLPEKINIRGMDALHLATANTLDFLRIHGVITYDKQMAKAAQALGFEVFLPTVK